MSHLTTDRPLISDRPVSARRSPRNRVEVGPPSGETLLSAAEECSHAEAIRRGDSHARARMIQANLGLVVRIARDYRGRGLDLDDLVGEGNLGLIRAVEDFDPSFGTRFSTYAAYWIRQAIRSALVNTTAAIRLPSHMERRLDHWRRAERSLLGKLGREPTFEEIADALDLSASQRVLVARALRSRRILREGGSDESGTYWSVDETAISAETPGARLEAAEERRDVLDRLDRLEDRERRIVVLRFGLSGEEPMTLKEVGHRLGLTREWVRRIEHRALRKLGKPTAPDDSRRRPIRTGLNPRRPALLVG